MDSLGIDRIQTEVLMKLGEYKFLTLSQLLSFDIGTKQYKYLWKKVKLLLDRRKPYVGRVRFNTIDRVGRVEDIYYLTKYGVKVLKSNIECQHELLHPRGNIISAKDYHHRMRTIDFQIKVQNWAEDNEMGTKFYWRYFDKKGNNRNSNTLSSLSKLTYGKGKQIIPDSLFIILKEHYERMFVFELHHGKDSKRIQDQIVNHLEALLSGDVHNQFNYPSKRAYYILVIFDQEGTLNSLIRRMYLESERFQGVHHLVLCKSTEALQSQPLDKGWTSILGHPYALTIKNLDHG